VSELVNEFKGKKFNLNPTLEQREIAILRNGAIKNNEIIENMKTENQKLKADIEALENIGMEKSLEAKKYKRLYEKAREGLSWYADESNWDKIWDDYNDDYIIYICDSWKPAKECLEELEK